MIYHKVLLLKVTIGFHHTMMQTIKKYDRWCGHSTVKPFVEELHPW